MERIIIFFFIFLVVRIGASDYPQPCDDKIFCVGGEGTLLHTVQMAHLYKDSKTFVDKPLKFSSEKVLENFDAMMAETSENPGKERVQTFVDENFLPEGTEFEEWTPSDWRENPSFLDGIADDNLRDFASVIHDRWKDLGRKINSTLKGSEKTSLVYLEHPFVVPGGRFREMYYWDSYWTVLGLLHSEMTETVKNMLLNFKSLIDRLGHIPNGNRIYYNRRTQPPLFIPMVDEYYKVTKDKEFIGDMIDAMDREFQCWLKNRTVDVTVDGQKYTVARYNVEVDGPRPESYREDYLDAQKFSSAEEKLRFYFNMKSGAESGWDYSTKWFVGETGEMTEDLLDIATTDIIPVELNSYLCKNARLLSEFYALLGNTAKSQEFSGIHQDFKNSIEAVLWNEEKGIWLDWDMSNTKQRPYFYPSNFAPLWTECYAQSKLLERSQSALNYLRTHPAFELPGGIPTSMVESNQQWDMPNGWPPLQHLVISGLENIGDANAKSMAKELAQKWVLNNYISYVQSDGAIFEKYDVKEIGLPGGGGEYDVQEGFGWTNGVLLDLFVRYGDILESKANGAASGITNSHLGVIFGQVFAWAIFKRNKKLCNH